MLHLSITAKFRDLDSVVRWYLDSLNVTDFVSDIEFVSSLSFHAGWDCQNHLQGDDSVRNPPCNLDISRCCCCEEWKTCMGNSFSCRLNLRAGYRNWLMGSIVRLSLECLYDMTLLRLGPLWSASSIHTDHNDAPASLLNLVVIGAICTFLQATMSCHAIYWNMIIFHIIAFTRRVDIYFDESHSINLRWCME